MLQTLFAFLILAVFSNFAFALQKVSLALPWYDQFQFAGYYMAQQKGYYKEGGLEVSFVPFDPKTDLTKSIEEGEIDYGIGKASLIAQWANGKKIVAIDTYLQSSPLIFLTKKRDDIKQLKDFIGKRVMFSRIDIYDALHTFLHSSNIALEDIVKQEHSYNVNDLIEDKTDVMAAYMSNEPFLLEEKGIEYRMFDPKDYGFEFYSDILYTSLTKVETNKEQVKAFREATLRGWRYAFDNLEETVDFIYKQYNPKKKSKKALIYEGMVLKKLSGIDTGELGDISLEKIKRIYDVFNLMGLIEFKQNSKKTLEFENFLFNEGYLHKLSLTLEEKEYLKGLGEIIAHNEMNWPPYNYNKGGVPKGFSIDYMNLLAQKLGMNVRYLSGYTWAQFMELLPSNKLDVMINIVKSEKREKSIVFTKPFTTVRNAIYVNKNNPNYNSLEDLKGKKIATIKGFFLSDYLKEHYPNIEQIYVDDQLEALQKLSLGQVDAVIVKKVIGDYLIRENELSNIAVTQFVSDTGLDSILRLGVSKEDKLLAQILDKAQEQVTDEEKRALMHKWFGVEEKKSLKKEFVLSQSQKEYLKNKKDISVCVRLDWLPYESFQDGDFIGLSADFLKLIQKEIQVPLRVVVSKSQAELYELMKKGACDLKPWIKVGTKNNLIPYMYTEEYIEDSYSLVTRVDEPFIQNLQSLEGKKIVLIEGQKYFIKYAQRKFPKTDFVYAKDISQALQIVYENKAFGYLGTSMTSSYYIQKDFSNDLKIAKDIDTFSFGFGVREDEVELLGIINNYLKNFPAIQKQNILNKWITIIAEQKHSHIVAVKLFIGLLAILLIAIFVIIKQNQLKNKIAEQKRAFEKLFIESYDAIILYDDKEKFIDCNEAYLKMFGFPDKESVKEIHTSYLSPMFQPDGSPSYDKIESIKAIAKRDGFYRFEWLHNGLDDKIFWCDIVFRIINQDKKSVTYIAIRNIQDRKETQLKLEELNKTLENRIQEEIKQSRQKDQQILHQSRLAQMGEMISMIAHQWRQPLAAISATSSNLTFKLIMEEEIQKDYMLKEIELISDYSQHLSVTIDDFRNFFKTKKVKQKSTLEAIIDDTLKIIRPSFESKNIFISVDYQCHGYLNTYAQEIKQVLLNILKNAEDALKDNLVEKPYIQIKTFKAEGKNILSIKDNAGGISEEIIEKIFDPYFSTKKAKDGTGLGLYMSKIIIEEHCKGALYVKNHSEGAEFFIEFESEARDDA